MASEREQLEKEKEEWAQATHRIEKSVPSSGMVKLNVGGKLFATSMETLTLCKGSFFDVMFSGRFPLKKEEDGAIFIDRDNKQFRFILDFMRGCFPPSLDDFSKREINELKVEAEFYQLIDLVNLISPPLPPIWNWKNGPNYTISNNGFTITKTDGVDDWTVTALAHQSIDVSKRGKYSWKVRIDNGIDHMIGVANTFLDQNAMSNFQNSGGWFFYTYNSTIYHTSSPSSPYPRTDQLPIGTIIGVHLDLDQRTLSFSVNGEMKGVAVRDFPLDKFPSLTLACCLVYKDSAVTVVE
eukprot:TRINITY_DN1971_c1_g1_i1.p1 TRINITY_DN1971_c1_g1~~TRINITY_DN1971_c1_g1_i1.p1  ORF type:complete len:296 (-),score=58.99 TRINITY_DN1971_c1_g1_i1:33-920(-)